MMAAGSAWTANPQRSTPVGSRFKLPLIAAKLCLGLGSFGAGLAVGRSLAGDDRTLIMVLTATAVLVALWSSFIIVQVVQNLAFRLVRAEPRPIRWHNGQRPEPRLETGDVSSGRPNGTVL